MTESDLPTTGRLAGIDYGTVRIGVALSDPNRTISSPWETYSRKSDQADRDYFCQFVLRERVVGFVVGLPVHMSGDESQKSLEARKFGEWLRQVTALPVCFHDERYSTAEANRLLAEAGSNRKRAKELRNDWRLN